MMKKLQRILLVALCAVLFVTTLTVPTTDAKAYVSSISISPSTSQWLYVNANSSYDKTVQLKAYVYTYGTTTDKSITWSSSDTSVATVSQDGLVTAKGEGTARIYATSNENPNKYDYLYVYVYDKKVTSVTLDASQITLYTKAKTSLGYKKQATLTATVSPTSADTLDVTWKSSKPSVATVSQNGKVTAKKAGTAIIYATSDSNKKVRATCRVVVRKFTEVTKVSANKSALTLYLTPLEKTNYSKTGSLTAKVFPTNATIKDVTWKSSKTSVASVTSSGVVTGKKAGTANITLTSRSNTKAKYTVKVTVKNTPFDMIYSKGLLPNLNTIYNTLKQDPEDIREKIDSVVTAADNLVALCKTHPTLKGTAFTYARRIQNYVDKIEERCNITPRPNDTTFLTNVKNAMNTVKTMKTYVANLAD